MKYTAIFKLYPNVVKIDNDVAYDEDDNIVSYDLDLVLAEVETAKQAEADAKQESQDKLAALGLTPEDLKRILGS
jgi:hypothetical protein